MPDPQPKTTPLHACHEAAGARFIDFGGWRMPVQYAGIMAEHRAVREAAGLFDISHMGQVLVGGDEAESYLNRVLSNNLARIEAGECQYTFLLNERGGVIDDLLAYRLRDGGFLLVINAARREMDLSHLRSHLTGGVELIDRSADFAGLALQGKRACAVFERFFGPEASRPSRNQVRRLERDGVEYLVARTGYTGEDGFELFFAAEAAESAWNDLLEAGRETGLQPCGLGARDTLRLEMCYPLNGSDLSPDHTPLEAGLSFFVDLTKPDFVGRSALLAQREAGVPRRLVPFRMTAKSPPPRAHYPVFKNGTQVAETTSGNLSPTLNIGIGMAYIPVEHARLHEELEIDIRGRRFPATIEKKAAASSHMNVPENLRYAKSHEWVRLEDDEAVIGITDHAQAELTDIVFVELPAVGSNVEAGNTVAVVESVKAASDIYSPVSGTVCEVNDALNAEPALVNTDPYGKGWLYKVEVQNATEVEKLQDAASYQAQIG